jgi:hypothetical protein
MVFGPFGPEWPFRAGLQARKWKAQWVVVVSHGHPLCLLLFWGSSMGRFEVSFRSYLCPTVGMKVDIAVLRKTRSDGTRDVLEFKCSMAHTCERTPSIAGRNEVDPERMCPYPGAQSPREQQAGEAF